MSSEDGHKKRNCNIDQVLYPKEWYNSNKTLHSSNIPNIVRLIRYRELKEKGLEAHLDFIGNQLECTTKDGVPVSGCGTMTGLDLGEFNFEKIDNKACGVIGQYKDMTSEEDCVQYTDVSYRAVLSFLRPIKESIFQENITRQTAVAKFWSYMSTPAASTIVTMSIVLTFLAFILIMLTGSIDGIFSDIIRAIWLTVTFMIIIGLIDRALPVDIFGTFLETFTCHEVPLSKDVQSDVDYKSDFVTQIINYHKAQLDRIFYTNEAIITGLLLTMLMMVYILMENIGGVFVLGFLFDMCVMVGVVNLFWWFTGSFSIVYFVMAGIQFTLSYYSETFLDITYYGISLRSSCIIMYYVLLILSVWCVPGSIQVSPYFMAPMKSIIRYNTQLEAVHALRLAESLSLEYNLKTRSYIKQVMLILIGLMALLVLMSVVRGFLLQETWYFKSLCIDLARHIRLLLTT